MNNKTKGIVIIILIVVILSFGMLIAYNYYTESPNKGTNFDQCTENCEDDKNGNSTSSTTSTSTIVTTTIDDNNNSYITTKKVARRTTTIAKTTTTTRMKTVVTTTVQTTEPEDTRALLLTGDITKEGTNGSVMYYFYDNGDLVIDGTGDAVMKDYDINSCSKWYECDSLIFKINQKMFWDAVKQKEPSFDLNELLSTEYGQEVYNGIFDIYINKRLKNIDDIIEYVMGEGISEEEARNAVYGGLSLIFSGDMSTVFDKANSLNFTLVDNLIIKNNVKVIGNAAFIMNNLRKITIPNSITTIGRYAFAYNRNIDNFLEIEFDDIENSKLTSILDFAFIESGLTDITIPSSVTTIGMAAFSSNNFKSVTILSKYGYPSNRFNEDWTNIGFPEELMPD